MKIFITNSYVYVHVHEFIIEVTSCQFQWKYTNKSDENANCSELIKESDRLVFFLFGLGGVVRSEFQGKFA
jgi:DNA-binding MurR/RpiR family transcriptional regulator